ncbi:MAG: hypothetical protein HY321_08225 [Armatimonadetes bacterium]|nr:hypothetical protein [Armatimonadota bacterium]
MVSEREISQAGAGAVGDGVTHINVIGVRYLPLAPASALRRAVGEYQAVRPAPRCETLSYLADGSSVVLCRGDFERALRASGFAAADSRLSLDARRMFAHVHDVLVRALPWKRQRAACSP